jgi:ribose 5-phosphate isomerase B
MERPELESLVRGLVERKLEQPTAQPATTRRLRVVTEGDVRDAGLGGTVLAEDGALITAAAEDLARAWGITIQRGIPVAKRKRRIALGADHGGYETKEEVRRFLLGMPDVEVLDLGTSGPQPVDYPDFALAVAEAVSHGDAEFGVMIDGAGIGSAMTANKVPGIRAAMCYDTATARNAREHNFANVLTLGGKMLDKDRVKEIVATFLATATGEERHAARVRKIMAVEKKYLR